MGRYKPLLEGDEYFIGMRADFLNIRWIGGSFEVNDCGVNILCLRYPLLLINVKVGTHEAHSEPPIPCSKHDEASPYPFKATLHSLYFSPPLEKTPSPAKTSVVPIPTSSLLFPPSCYCHPGSDRLILRSFFP